MTAGLKSAGRQVLLPPGAVPAVLGEALALGLAVPLPFLPTPDGRATASPSMRAVGNGCGSDCGCLHGCETKDRNERHAKQCTRRISKWTA